MGLVSITDQTTLAELQCKNTSFVLYVSKPIEVTVKAAVVCVELVNSCE